jgi:hypothetical protein
MNPEPPSGLATDELFELQLRIARRADDIAQSRSVRTSMNLECWLLAEEEFLGCKALTRTKVEVLTSGLVVPQKVSSPEHPRDKVIPPS